MPASPPRHPSDVLRARQRRRYVSWPAAQQAVAALLWLTIGCAPAGGDGTPPLGTTDAGQTAEQDATAVPTDDVQGQPAASQLSPGDPIEVANNSKYFSRANEVIQTAQTKLRIVQFETGPGDAPDLLVQAVIAAKNRGVDVRVLLDDEVSYNQTTMADLKAAGVTVKFDSSKLRTHCKVVASEQGFIIGSTNWSSTSISKNNESNILVRDAGLTAQLHAWLDKLWNSPSTSISMSSSKSSVATLYADGGYAALAGPAIDSAKTKIRMVTYGMNVDPKDSGSLVTQTVQKLGKAKGRGVDVQVLMDMGFDPTEVGADINQASADYMKTLGIHVRADPPAKITHAKFLMIDDKIVILGSNNWGYGGFSSYHEVGAKFSQPKPIADLSSYFDGIWAVSTDL